MQGLSGIVPLVPSTSSPSASASTDWIQMGHSDTILIDTETFEFTSGGSLVRGYPSVIMEVSLDGQSVVPHVHPIGDVVVGADIATSGSGKSRVVQATWPFVRFTIKAGGPTTTPDQEIHLAWKVLAP